MGSCQSTCTSCAKGQSGAVHPSRKVACPHRVQKHTHSSQEISKCFTRRRSFRGILKETWHSGRQKSQLQDRRHSKNTKLGVKRPSLFEGLDVWSWTSQLHLSLDTYTLFTSCLSSFKVSCDAQTNQCLQSVLQFLLLYTSSLLLPNSRTLQYCTATFLEYLQWRYFLREKESYIQQKYPYYYCQQ